MMRGLEVKRGRMASASLVRCCGRGGHGNNAAREDFFGRMKTEMHCGNTSAHTVIPRSSVHRCAVESRADETRIILILPTQANYRADTDVWSDAKYVGFGRQTFPARQAWLRRAGR